MRQKYDFQLGWKAKPHILMFLFDIKLSIHLFIWILSNEKKIILNIFNIFLVKISYT